MREEAGGGERVESLVSYFVYDHTEKIGPDKKLV